jgi:hypothetical protein
LRGIKHSFGTIPIDKSWIRISLTLDLVFELRAANELSEGCKDGLI